MIRFKKIMVVMLAVVFAISLCACGEKGSKVKDYAGYYTYSTSDSGSVLAVAINISKKGEVVYSGFTDLEHYAINGHAITYGTINVEGNKAFFYNTDFHGDGLGTRYLDWKDYFPLTLTLINDGNGLYCESDSDSWSPGSYTKVSKKDYEAFLKENELFQTNEELDKWVEENTGKPVEAQ